MDADTGSSILSCVENPGALSMWWTLVKKSAIKKLLALSNRRMELMKRTFGQSSNVEA